MQLWMENSLWTEATVWHQFLEKPNNQNRVVLFKDICLRLLWIIMTDTAVNHP